MCGIFGFNWSDKTLLKKMNSVLTHRGPDDAAFYEDKNISLGMRRLSIIDLKKGIYPVKNETEDIIAIFNGELYNYKEIRSDLVKKGHRFITDCDAEIIPHAYEEYGEKFISKLNGQFAICMYDIKNKKLFLIRDRLGIKPIYYYHNKNKFGFASEIKCLLELPGFKKQINEIALNSYFTHRYFPGEDTLFKGIKRLLPGHYLVLGKKLEVKKYWDIHFSANNNSVQNNALFVKNLLENSVKMRLMSDVPLGAYLSGGLDSTAIVSFMSKHSDNVNTFNVSFTNTEFDESEYARFVAEHYSTNHTQIDVEIDAIKTLPEVAWHLDEPIADAATIPTYLMSKETKKKVTVVLSGEGSDEIFGGYERFKHLNIAYKFRHLPFKNFAKTLNFKNIAMQRGAKLFSNLNNQKQAYLSYYSVFDTDEKKQLYKKFLDKEYDFDFNGSFYNNLLKLDIKERLPNNMLLKNDKMTMGASLEARVPFLDHRLVELSTKIPFNQKVSLLQDKIVYRKAVKNVIPRKIQKRKKTGFTIPTEKWAREGLKDYLFDLVKENKEPYLNNKYIQKITSRLDKSFYYKRQFWAVLMYEQWYNRFMK